MLKLPIFGFLQGADRNWLLVSNLLIIFSIVLIPAVFLPYNKKLESLLQTAVAEGRLTPELRTILNEPTNERARTVEEIVVLVIAALMVLKPF